MKIMFIGLGLIGGSMAMALEGYPDLECYAVDGDEPTRLDALGRNVVRAAWRRKPLWKRYARRSYAHREQTDWLPRISRRKSISSFRSSL